MCQSFLSAIPDQTFPGRARITVFLFPFWEDIYVQDMERKQDKEEAQDTCRVLRETYEEWGYQILTVPFGTPEEREEWIAGRTQSLV